MEIVILGNGISGITTARHIRKQDPSCGITVVSSETKYFFSRTALMYVYMGHMKFEHTQPYENGFWEKNRIRLEHKAVEKIDTEAKKLLCAGGSEIPYDKLVLATGSLPNKFGWPGQDSKGVGGLYSRQDLEYVEKHSVGLKRAVIVGGGLIGIEMAEMFLSRGIETVFLVKEKSYWDKVLPPGESAMITRHIRKHHVDLRLDTGLAEIIPDENGRVKAVKTTAGDVVECGFVGLTAGVSPNIAVAKQSGIACKRGVLINEYFETSIPNVYAIGDCAEFKEAPAGRRNIEQVWYTGRMHGETLASSICGKKTPYRPGPWFNSAKFFDIEYQTYGDVPAEMPIQFDNVYWEHPSGEKCINIVYDRQSHGFVGINSFGIRMRHEVFDCWLREKKGVGYVLENLAQANFNPEFFKTFEHEIAAVYNLKHPDKKIVFKTKKRFLSFLGI